MNNFSQESIFIFFFIIGNIIGLIFDLFRVIRKNIKTPDIITFFEDTVFFIISGIIIIGGIIKLNNGEIRAFLFLGVIFGLLLYFLTISKLYVIILSVFINLCKKIFKIPYLYIKKLQKYVFTVTKKDF